jgi:hypothetical protein
MTKKLKVCFLLLLLTLVTVFSVGCTPGASSLVDATAVQLETSLISGMNSMLTFVMYKAFGVYNQAAQLGAV